MLYFVILIVYSISLAHSCRKSLGRYAIKKVSAVFAHKILCMWDCSIANSELSKQKHRKIYIDMQKVLMSDVDSNRNDAISSLKRFLNPIFINIFVYLLILSSAPTIWTILKACDNTQDQCSHVPMICLCLVRFGTLLGQKLLKWVAKYENYAEPIKCLLNTLIRIFVLEVVTVGTLIYFSIQKQGTCCWETEVGYNISLLIISDVIQDLFLLPTITLLWVLIVKHLKNLNYVPQFDVLSESINIMYNQMLVWIGLPFAPLLAGILIIKLLFGIYIKKFMLIYVYKNACKTALCVHWQIMLSIFSFISFLGMLLTLGFIMTHIPLSPDCGPFRNYNFITDASYKLHYFHGFISILKIIVRPGIIGGVLISMSVLVYYLRAKSCARYLVVKQLKKLIKLEIHDKKLIVLDIIRMKNQLNENHV